VLQDLGYTGHQAIAAFPPVLLDRLSTDLLMACNPEDGIDLLAHYMPTPTGSARTAHKDVKSPFGEDGRGC